MAILHEGDVLRRERVLKALERNQIPVDRAIEQHDGQAIRMAQALGADLAHMDATEVAFLIDPQQTARGILVNGRGQRYVPEDMYSGRIGQLTLYHQDDTAFLIIDGDAQDEAEKLRAEIMGSVQQGRPHEMTPFTGQTAGLVRDVIPAGEIVRKLMSEAEEALRAAR